MRRLLAVTFGLLLTSCPGDLKEALRIYGYTPVRPASTFWQPGALVYIRNYEPFEVGYICSAKQVMGENYKPMQSPTINADLAKATKRGVTFNTDLADLVSGDADLHAIKSIKMSLRNARIFEINDNDIDHRTGAIDASCVRNVVRRRAQGMPITMISSALQADVIYTVQWDNSSKLDASAKVAQLETLAMKLGVEASSLGGKTIEAKGLIWGIRDDAYLAHLFDPKHLQPVDRRASRLITEDAMPTLTVGFDEMRRPSVAPPGFGQSVPRPPRTSSRRPNTPPPLDPVDEGAPEDADVDADSAYGASAVDASRPGLTAAELEAQNPSQDVGPLGEPAPLAAPDIFPGVGLSGSGAAIPSAQGGTATGATGRRRKPSANVSFSDAPASDAAAPAAQGASAPAGSPSGTDPAPSDAAPQAPTEAAPEAATPAADEGSGGAPPADVPAEAVDATDAGTAGEADAGTPPADAAAAGEAAGHEPAAEDAEAAAAEPPQDAADDTAAAPAPGNAPDLDDDATAAAGAPAAAGTSVGEIPEPDDAQASEQPAPADAGDAEAEPAEPAEAAEPAEPADDAPATSPTSSDEATADEAAPAAPTKATPKKARRPRRGGAGRRNSIG